MGSKYLSKIVLDGGVNNSIGSILFEFHVVLDHFDGNFFGILVGINDESHWIQELWIRIDISFCGTGVVDNIIDMSGAVGGTSTAAFVLSDSRTALAASNLS